MMPDRVTTINLVAIVHQLPDIQYFTYIPAVYAQANLQNNTTAASATHPKLLADTAP